MTTVYSIQRLLYRISQSIITFSCSIEKMDDTFEDGEMYEALKESLPKMEECFNELKALESELVRRLEIEALTQSAYNEMAEEEQKWLLEHPQPGPEYRKCRCGSTDWCSKATCG